MKMVIQFQNKLVPVYIHQAPYKKTMDLLLKSLENKIENGRSLMKKCLSSLISIEIIDNEAILHSLSENDSLVLSLA